MRRLVTLFAAAALFAVPALADDVPGELEGHWAADGQCDNAEASIHIGEGTLAMAGGDPAAITYFEDDSPAGNGAIHWAEEGNVDNFEYAADADQLLYNAQGYGMGIPPVAYQRCPS